MIFRLRFNLRRPPAILGAVTLLGVAVLLGWDAFPRLFPTGSHAVLAPFSLAMIVVAYLAYQIARRPAFIEFLKAILLAVAFLFWRLINSGRTRRWRCYSMTSQLPCLFSMFFW
jgi:hypothetical protein